MTCTSLRTAVVCFTTLTFSAALAAQEAPPPPKPAPAVVAGIPVNYDEAKVGTYTLPDPLVWTTASLYADAKAWTKKRRPEIVSLFETQQYGKAPGRPAAESFDVFDKGTPALNGKAIRKQVMIYLTPTTSVPQFICSMYLPAGRAEARSDVSQHQLRRGTERGRRSRDQARNRLGPEDQHTQTAPGGTRLRTHQRRATSRRRHSESPPSTMATSIPTT